MYHNGDLVEPGEAQVQQGLEGSPKEVLRGSVNSHRKLKGDGVRGSNRTLGGVPGGEGLRKWRCWTFAGRGQGPARLGVRTAAADIQVNVLGCTVLPASSCHSLDLGLWPTRHSPEFLCPEWGNDSGRHQPPQQRGGEAQTSQESLEILTGWAVRVSWGAGLGAWATRLL